ncbi:MAG: non-heme iron oxygenase ferredoxin subunit [Longimicrobiales bacterium]
MTEWHRVASMDDVAPGSTLRVELDGAGICLCNVDGTIYALRDNCSHKDFPLSEGELEGARLECKWHGARFDVTTGRAVQLPAIKPVKTYEVRVEGKEILIAFG